MDEIKALLVLLDNKQVTLEDLLCKVDFVHSTIKLKFNKFEKYFLEGDWIERMIVFAFGDPLNQTNYQTLSHNSAEILSQVKSKSFITELVKHELTDSGRRYKHLDLLFSIGLRIRSSKENYSGEMLSGYFERIFYCLMLKKRTKVKF